MIKKLFKGMIISQILSQLAVTLCMLIDSIMIGQFLGVDAMAAYGFANPILLVFTAIGGLLSTGTQVVCSTYLGRGDSESIDKAYSSAITGATIISVVGIALIIILITPLVKLLGADPASPTFEMTKDYLIGFAIGIPTFMIALIFIPFLQMAGKQNILVIAILGMTVADIVFDFANAKLGLFGGGIFGMGLASSLSYVVAFIVALFYFVRKDSAFTFKLSLANVKSFTEVLKGGMPTTINQVSSVILILLFNNILATIGTRAVAAHSVISTVANILYSFGTGIGAVTLTLGGIFYGEEDKKSIFESVKLGLKYSIIIDAVLVAAVFVGASGIVNMFLASDAESLAAYDLAVKGLRIFVIGILPCCLTAVLKAYCQGTGKMLYANIVSILQNLVYAGVIALILVNFTQYAVWIALMTGEFLSLATYAVIASIKAKKPTLAISALTFIDDSFGTDESQLFEMSIKSVDDAVAASSQASQFCVSNGMKKTQASMVGLCIEELACNTLKYGFEKNAKGQPKNNIELRLIYKGDELMLRLRDDCVNFDPIKYMELHQDDDPIAHIGIRTTFKIVKDAKYINSLGLNNLTLTM